MQLGTHFDHRWRETHGYREKETSDYSTWEDVAIETLSGMVIKRREICDIWREWMRTQARRLNRGTGTSSDSRGAYLIAQRECCCCCCCCWSISTKAAFKSNEDGDDGTMVGGKLLLLFAREEFIRFVAWRTWWESTKDWFFGGRPGPRFFVAISGRSRAFAAPDSPWESFAALVSDDELGRLWRVWPADCFIIDAGVPLEQSRTLIDWTPKRTLTFWLLKEVEEVESRVLLDVRASTLRRTGTRPTMFVHRCQWHYSRLPRIIDRRTKDPAHERKTEPTGHRAQWRISVGVRVVVERN